ncbi:MAG TPA: hypothetical protein VF331_23295 [Polyangiales bacterium]
MTRDETSAGDSSFVPSAIEWLWLALLVGFSWHYFWLMDDSFIYYRYVDNLLFLGRGLVFNAGEYVEGYTSPAWLLLLVPFRALRLDYWTIVHGLSVAVAATYGLLLVRLNRELSPPGSSALNLPLAIAAGHYGITEHFSSGLETPLVQLWAVLVALWITRPRSRFLGVLVSLAPLVRPELALPALLCAAGVWISTRRVPLAFCLAGALANGAWLAFRVYYYADFLPNTYYLKGQTNWMQGAWYLASGAVGQWWIWLIPAAWVVVLVVRRARAHGELFARALMVAAATAVLVWVAKVGGDMMYHRFLAFPTTLLLCSIAGVTEAVLATVRRPLLQQAALAACGVVAFGLSLASYPVTLVAHPLAGGTTRHWHAIDEAMWHRQHLDLALTPDKRGLDAQLQARYAAITPAARQQLDVLVHPWCRRAFFEYAKYMINSYGLTDSILAHIDVGFARPGHKRTAGRAAELGKIVQQTGAARGVGMYRRAVARHRAPRWVANNLTTIELIERKVYNRHRFFENLGLALQPTGRIKL